LAVSAGSPTPSYHRWWEFIRFSVVARIAAVVIFGSLIFLYNLGGHYIGERGPQIATTSTPQDGVAQSNLMGAAGDLRTAYVFNHNTFTGITATVMQSSSGGQLQWSEPPESSTSDHSPNFAASGPIVTVALLSTSGSCWFARVNMELNGGLTPGGLYLVGQTHAGCSAANPPPAEDWSIAFPTKS
jgi:hypothetical protein